MNEFAEKDHLYNALIFYWHWLIHGQHVKKTVSSIKACTGHTAVQGDAACGRFGGRGSPSSIPPVCLFHTHTHRKTHMKKNNRKNPEKQSRVGCVGAGGSLHSIPKMMSGWKGRNHLWAYVKFDWTLHMLRAAVSHSHAAGGAVPWKSRCLEAGRPLPPPCSGGNHRDLQLGGKYSPPQVTGEDKQMHFRERGLCRAILERAHKQTRCLTSHLIFREKREVKKKNIHIIGQMMRPSQNILASASVPLLLPLEDCTHI